MQKNKLSLDLLRSWYLYESLHSSPILKNSENVVKSRLQVVGFGQLSLGWNPNRKTHGIYFAKLPVAKAWKWNMAMITTKKYFEDFSLNTVHFGSNKVAS